MRHTLIGIAAFLFLFAPLARAHAPQGAVDALGNKMPEVKLEGVGFSDAVDFLRDVSGANIHVDWRALEAAGISKDTQVTLHLKDVPLRRVLTLLLADAGGATPLDYYIDEGVIEITTRELADHNMITRVFPIDDLMVDVPDFPSPVNMDLSATATGGSAGGSGGARGSQGGSSGSLFGGNTCSAGAEKTLSKAERADQIVALIRDTVYPDVWRENGGAASIRYFDGKLVVTAPRYVIDAIGG
jgi:hypothetical protein